MGSSIFIPEALSVFYFGVGVRAGEQAEKHIRTRTYTNTHERIHKRA
jgi:hypothetical protein